MDAVDPGSDAQARLSRALSDLAALIVEVAGVRALCETSNVADRLLTVTEAADLLRISRSTVYQLMAEGSLRSLRVRGRRLIAESDLAQLTGTRT